MAWKVQLHLLAYVCARSSKIFRSKDQLIIGRISSVPVLMFVEYLVFINTENIVVRQYSVGKSMNGGSLQRFSWLLYGFLHIALLIKFTSSPFNNFEIHLSPSLVFFIQAKSSNIEVVLFSETSKTWFYKLPAARFSPKIESF